MALFELNIYGADDEIVKRYETNHVRWGVYLQATEVQENLNGKDTATKFKAINNFMKKIFPELTDAEIENADADDILNTFMQLINKANGIKGAAGNDNDEKNA